MRGTLRGLIVTGTIIVVAGIASASGRSPPPAHRAPIAPIAATAPARDGDVPSAREFLDDPVMRMYASFALSRIDEQRLERDLALSPDEVVRFEREVQAYRDAYYAMIGTRVSLRAHRARLTALVLDSSGRLRAMLGEARWGAALERFRS